MCLRFEFDKVMSIMTGKVQKVDDDYQSLVGECSVLKCRLDSKTEALLILSRELDKYRSERDQYKLMANQLRERYNALKKRVEGLGPSLLGVYDVRGFSGEREQSLAQLLCELKEQNKSLQFEVDNLKQKLNDAEGDIKLLREQIARQRVGSGDEGVIVRHFPAYEREDLVKQLESFKQKCHMLEKDLQAVFDEKEELVTARDAYRHKVERLNHQLNCMLRGDKHHVVDIDAVLMDNRFLQERMKQVQEEKAMAMATLSKYKSILEKKRNRNGLRLSSLGTGFISTKQVQQLLQTNPFLELTNNPSNIADLRNLVVALFESLNDKTLALSHQKKTNKILGNRVTELEKKIKAMEVSGIWSSQDSVKLCVEENCHADEDHTHLDSLSNSPPIHSTPNHLPLTKSVSEPCHCPADQENGSSEIGHESGSGSGFSDLDLLPTKETSFPSDEFGPSSSSCTSRISSAPSTPLHLAFPENETMHSDTEILTKRPYSRNTESSHRRQRLDEQLDSVTDDLPPQLQKLLDAALAEIEQNQCSEKKNVDSDYSSSPKSSGNQERTNDPNC